MGIFHVYHKGESHVKAEMHPRDSSLPRCAPRVVPCRGVSVHPGSQQKGGFWDQMKLAWNILKAKFRWKSEKSLYDKYIYIHINTYFIKVFQGVADQDAETLGGELGCRLCCRLCRASPAVPFWSTRCLSLWCPHYAELTRQVWALHQSFQVTGITSWKLTVCELENGHWYLIYPWKMLVFQIVMYQFTRYELYDHQ